MGKRTFTKNSAISYAPPEEYKQQVLIQQVRTQLPVQK